MKIMIHVAEEGEKGLHEMEVLLIDKGHETIVAELSEIDHACELDIEFPQAIVVRPAQK